MKVEQYVMAYGVEQDRLRALLPSGFTSLRPVLRINAEIRTDDTETVYLEFNTPVEAHGKRGWLNIAHWDSTQSTLTYQRDDKTVTFSLPFLTLSHTGAGVEGGCPAERDNDGCFLLNEAETFRPAESINANKEFCDCRFAWRFTEHDAHGVSTGETLPAFLEEAKTQYEPQSLTAENAAAIPCLQVLGAYVVRFERT